jgi:hypothetical protein
MWTDTHDLTRVRDPAIKLVLSHIATLSDSFAEAQIARSLWRIIARAPTA